MMQQAPNTMLRGLCLCALGVMLAAIGCSDGRIADPSGGGPDFDGLGVGTAGSSGGGLGPGAGGGAGSSGSMPGFTAEPASLRKLTVVQYQSSVRDLFGDDITPPTDLEADSAVNGFVAIGAAKATLSPVAVEKLEQAAYDVAAQALAEPRRESFVGCAPTATLDTACTTAFVQRLGGRAFRRPLTAAETTRYVGLAENAATKLGDYWQGLELAIAGLLQSPAFLFRAELGEPIANDATRKRYTGYELASRLSFLLWNTTPDDELLAAAASGALDTAAGLSAQAQRLLASDRLKAALDNFHSERLGLSDLATLEKSSSVYTGMDDSLREAMRQDVLRTLEEYTFGSDTDFRNVLTTRVSYVNPALAGIYGVSAGSSALTRTMLPDDGPRMGLVGKAAYLALAAHDNATSPTKRGKAIRERMLCESIPAPPPNVITVLPEPDANAATMRDRLKVHAMNPSCNTCHQKMDPLGLSLEHFDAVGRFREDDNGHALDTSGELDGATFSDAAGLARALHDEPRTMACVARQAYRYAVGHVETPGERTAIDELEARFSDSGYRFTALLEAVVQSDGFRFASGADE